MRHIKTKKGIIYIGRRYVLKKYEKDGSGRAESEFEALKRIKSILGKREREGWTYESVKPIKLIGDSFIMEKVNGRSLGKMMFEREELVKKSGVWLSIFHNASIECTEDRYNIYCISDFNRTNIYFNLDKNKVMFIDPGYGFWDKKPPEWDIINMIYSLNMNLIRSMRLGRIKYVTRLFLEGYYSVSKIEFENNIYQNTKNKWIARKIRERKKYGVPEKLLRELVFRVILKKLVKDICKERSN